MRTTVLAVLRREHQDLLCKIADRSGWDLDLAQTFDGARELLARRPSVVISECCLPDGCSWKNILIETRTMSDPPQIIVASPVAEAQEDSLWAEVLNLGGYDLLVLPFDPTTVVHVVNSAWLSRTVDQQRMAHTQARSSAA